MAAAAMTITLYLYRVNHFKPGWKVATYFTLSAELGFEPLNLEMRAKCMNNYTSTEEQRERNISNSMKVGFPYAV